MGFQNFNREFDYVIETQKQYCVLDVENAQMIRQQIKRLVLKPYAEFTSKYIFLWLSNIHVLEIHKKHTTSIWIDN